ncbi:MAG: response regulator transcription factor [Candidatus Limnocylindrales bacterium]
MTDAEQPTATAGQRVRLAIVDDHPVLRDGLASLLDRELDLVIVATGATANDATRLLASADIDVLVLDVRLGQASGFESLSDAVEDAPRPAVVVLTAFDYPQYAEAALRLGASAFVLKSAPIGELLGAIRRAAAGGLTFSKRPGSAVSLTRRELEVIRLVSEGRSNDEIATALGMGPKTVETHLRKVFERHDIASRTELAARAIREGWLELPLPAASPSPQSPGAKPRSET